MPIGLFNDKVLDGRRRLRACRIAGIEPDVIVVEPKDPVAYVLSLNLHRRHLSTSQKSIVAAKARGIHDKAAKARMKAGGRVHKDEKGQIKSSDPSNGQSRDTAGVALGVSGASVDRATNVLKKGVPELIEAVESGRVTVNMAAKVAKMPVEEQKEIVAKEGKISISPKPGSTTRRGVELAHQAIGRRAPEYSRRPPTECRTCDCCKKRSVVVRLCSSWVGSIVCVRPEGNRLLHKKRSAYVVSFVIGCQLLKPLARKV